MFRNKNIQRYMAYFLSGLYAFAIVFSANFHQHSDSILSSITLKGSKDVHFSSDVSSSSKDCPVCHFNSTNYFQIPDVVEIATPFMQDSHPHSIIYVSEILLHWKSSLNPRGPPVFVFS